MANTNIVKLQSYFNNVKWKPIVGYESLYIISTNGDVIMTGRKKRHINGKYSEVKPCITSQHIISGYKKVKIRDLNGVAKMISVHRLVAITFIQNPNNLPQVNHKDEDKLNNSVDNLEWCTAKYNSNYGTGIKRCSELRFKPVIRISLDGTNISAWRSMKEASRETETPYTSISQCCHNKQKTCKGYIWEFL